MTDQAGVQLPPRLRPASVGSRWLGVIPIAQAAVIGDEVLVQLIALARRDNGAILMARISRLREMVLTEPREGIPWPSLDISARDDTGTSWPVDGGAGNGSQSDWDVQFGLMGRLPESARRLDFTVTELRWEDVSTGTVGDRKTGSWTFTVDLTRQLDARLV